MSSHIESNRKYVRKLKIRDTTTVQSNPKLQEHQPLVSQSNPSTNEKENKTVTVPINKHNEERPSYSSLNRALSQSPNHSDDRTSPNFNGKYRVRHSSRGGRRGSSSNSSSIDEIAVTRRSSRFVIFQENANSLRMFIDDFFEISDRKSTIGTEIRAGVVTFLTMSYIVLVNPKVLNVSGLPLNYAASSTCFASFCATLIVGLFGNLPVGCAPGVGLSAYFSYGMMKSISHSLPDGEYVPYQTGLSIVFLAGSIVLLLTCMRIIPFITSHIPKFIKVSTVVGMGCFLSFIGVSRFHLVVSSTGDALVALGDLDWTVWLGLFNIAFIATLEIHQVKGSLLWSVILIAVIYFAATNTWPTHIAATPSFANPAEIFSFKNFPFAHSVSPLISFILILIFDVSGCIYGIGRMADLMETNERGQTFVQGGDWALIAASVGTIIAAVTGCSPIIVHIESAAGVAVGGRTGLTSITIALLFGLSIFLSPLFGRMPDVSTAPVLVFVGTLMMRQVTEINWREMSIALPSFLTIVMMPFTFSIANGIFLGIGFYLLLLVTSGDIFSLCGCPQLRKRERCASDDYATDLPNQMLGKQTGTPDLLGIDVDVRSPSDDDMGEQKFPSSLTRKNTPIV